MGLRPPMRELPPILLALAAVLLPATATVTYNHKAIIINGQCRSLISGSIHHQRSVPEMWPDLIQEAKDGGFDVIQTYVLWNGHEPPPGQYYFKEAYDLIRFLELVKQAGLYVHLRIGPSACAEWNFGGFPVCLKYVPGISFRTANRFFKAAMEKFTQKILYMMKSEGLLQSQGGPIVISQIANEFGPVEYNGGAPAKAYAAWWAKMAVGISTGVRWLMCKQDDAPDPVQKPSAIKWGHSKVNNYEKLCELFARDRATGEGATTAAEIVRQWEGESFAQVDLDSEFEQIEINLDSPSPANIPSQVNNEATASSKSCEKWKALLADKS